MKFDSLVEVLADLVRRNSCDLPADVEAALGAATRRAVPSSAEALALNELLDNVKLARAAQTPMCQDTGTLSFFFTVRPGTSCTLLRQAAEAAVEQATARGWLRRNTIDSPSGKSIDSNVTAGAPDFHFEEDPSATAVEVALLQKGGGSENMSCQFSLPDVELDAGRDLEGVRRCVLQAAQKAQGFGCAPGVLGVCIGGDRASGYLQAKRQLLRPLDEPAVDPALAELERRLLDEINSLGIGAMGLGGKTTVLGVKIGALPRLPASYFVSVAYCCWACRRHHIRIEV